MSWAFRIGTIAGTIIRVHVTFILVLIWVVVAQWQTGRPDTIATELLFVILLFGCVVAHEFGHIFAARRFGIRTPDVTLWMMGGVARMEAIPRKATQEIMVALAGPGVNLCVAGLLLGALVVGAEIPDFGQESPAAGIVGRLAAANIVLGIFNLVPAFPMDGGRILRAFLSVRMGRRGATRLAVQIGQCVAFLLALAGLFISPVLTVIGFFIYLATIAEEDEDLGDDLSGLIREAMSAPDRHLALGVPVTDAVNLFAATTQKELAVVDQTRRPLGVLTARGLLKEIAIGGFTATVTENMICRIPSIQAAQSPETAFWKLSEASVPAVLVLDEAGCLAGLVSRDTVGNLLLMRAAATQ